MCSYTLGRPAYRNLQVTTINVLGVGGRIDILYIWYLSTALCPDVKITYCSMYQVNTDFVAFLYFSELRIMYARVSFVAFALKCHCASLYIYMCFIAVCLWLSELFINVTLFSFLGMTFCSIHVSMAFLETVMITEHEEGWEWKSSKCYDIKKQIEPFHIHPLVISFSVFLFF